jgi:hypothetical protein
MKVGFIMANRTKGPKNVKLSAGLGVALYACCLIAGGYSRLKRNVDGLRSQKKRPDGTSGLVGPAKDSSVIALIKRWKESAVMVETGKDKKGNSILAVGYVDSDGSVKVPVIGTDGKPVLDNGKYTFTTGKVVKDAQVPDIDGIPENVSDKKSLEEELAGMTID